MNRNSEANIAILHEDDNLLVVNKPAGLLSVQDGYDSLIPHVRTTLEPEYGRLWMVHRLDKETSGVMVLARNAETHRELNRQFLNHEVQKTYHAVVIGLPDWDAKTVDAPLRANVGRRKRTVVDPRQGKSALTAYQVLERFQNHSLIAAFPKTGRTHQIRVHLYHLGFPILADHLYGEGQSSDLIGRMALHAESILIKDPSEGKIATFTVPYPLDFEALLHEI